MISTNKVFIATSLDGFISDKDGGLDWLNATPNPEGNDLGFGALMDSVDALIMGRNTYEVVDGFGGDWPYTKPVFLLSASMKEVPSKYEGKVELLSGSIQEILKQLKDKGFSNFYIDGGKTIQGFLKEDLIDELIITTIPILLGGGASLFGDLIRPLEFELVDSKVYLDNLVQSHFRRKR